MKSLNLKGFKKVSSDGKTTTFQKDGGHKIVIAHSALSKDMQKQLSDLPHYDGGGEVSSPDDLKVTKYDNSPNNGYDLYHENENGQDPGRSPASAATPQEADIEQQLFDSGNPTHAPDPTSNPSNWSGDVYNLGNQAGTNTGPSSPAASDGTADAPSSQAQNQDPVQSPQSTLGMNPSLFSAGAQEEKNQLTQGMQGYGEAVNKEARATDVASDAMAQDTMAHADAIQKVQGSYQQAHNDITQRRQDLISDLQAGHINPNHYMENLGSGQKVATAIGLVLGGFGAGLTHQTNPALDFLNKQIDRDVEAQKLNLGKQENLLSANFRESGDLNDATAMTRVNLADIYSSQLQAKAMQLKSQTAMPLAQQAISQLQMKVAPELGQITQKVATGKLLQSMQGANITPESKIQMYQMAGVMPPEDANKAMDELKSSRDADNVKNNILTAANKITQEQTLGNRVMSPFQSSQQINNLNSMIHVQAAKTLGARYTPEVAKEMDNLTAGLTSGKTTSNQMQAVLNNIFGQKENYPYLSKWGLNQGGSKAFNSQGQSNFQTGTVK